MIELHSNSGVLMELLIILFIILNLIIIMGNISLFGITYLVHLKILKNIILIILLRKTLKSNQLMITLKPNHQKSPINNQYTLSIFPVHIFVCYSSLCCAK